MAPLWILFGAVTIIWLLVRKGRLAQHLDKLPGPKAYPIVGSIFEFIGKPREELLKYVIERNSKHGSEGIYRNWLGWIPEAHITSPEYAEVLLSSSKHINKGPLYRFLDPWLGQGLLTSSGQKWHKNRKLLTPAFHFKILEGFVPMLQENCDILVARLSKYAESGEEFNIYQYITACALDNICETAMGTKVFAQKDSESEYVAAIYRISELMVKRVIKIWLHSDIAFNLSAIGKESQKLLKHLHGFTRNVIQERRIERQKIAEPEHRQENLISESGSKRKVAFLDLLLKAAEEANMTDEEIRAEVDTFMFEGHDTTTAALCWTLLLLGLHPEIQDKVYAELQEIFQNNLERPITMADLGNMKLLERVIKESLRLYPSVALFSRFLYEDVNFGKYLVPKGTTAVVHVTAIHKHPQWFPEPEKFDPDRFLPDASRNRHPYAYIPFSAGPRNCIGQKFAMMEEKVVLASLLRNYKFHSMESRQDVVMMGEIVVRPKSGIRMTIAKRL